MTTSETMAILKQRVANKMLNLDIDVLIQAVEILQEAQELLDELTALIEDE